MARFLHRFAFVSRLRVSGLLWPAVLLMCLSAVSLGLHLEKDHRKEKALAMRRQFVSRGDVGRVERVKAGRSRFYLGRRYLESGWKSSYATADFIRRLTDIIRPPLQLRNAEMDCGWQDIRFNLTVAAGSEAGGAVEVLFGDFCRRLSVFPDVGQLAFTRASEQSLRAVGDVGRDLVMHISGQLELE